MAVKKFEFNEDEAQVLVASLILRESSLERYVRSNQDNKLLADAYKQQLLQTQNLRIKLST